MECAVWTQTVVLFLTGIVIAWYTYETRGMHKEITRQNSIALRPVVVFEFKQDEAHNRLLIARNIGQGAAFNIVTTPLNVIPGDEAWDIHFDSIHSLASHQWAEVGYRMPVLEERADRGYVFFPQATSKQRDLRIEYEDVEGGRYRQDLTVYPRKEGADSGHVTYAPIQPLPRNG